MSKAANLEYLALLLAHGVERATFKTTQISGFRSACCAYFRRDDKKITTSLW